MYRCEYIAFAQVQFPIFIFLNFGSKLYFSVAKLIQLSSPKLSSQTQRHFLLFTFRYFVVVANKITLFFLSLHVYASLKYYTGEGKLVLNNG